MFWIFALVVFAVLCLAFVISKKSRQSDLDANLISKVAMGIVTVLFLLITIAHSVHIVEAGNVGIVKTFGGISGASDNADGGLMLTAPWESVSQVNSKVIKVVPDSVCRKEGGDIANCLTASSHETQDAYIVPVLNLYVDPENVKILYRTVGPNYIDVIVQPLLSGAVKDAVVKRNATNIRPEQVAIRQEVTTALKASLDKYSIVVQEFVLADIEFSPEFAASIEAKVTAEQNAITETNKVEVEKAKAEQARQQGIASANKIREEAKGQADANALITGSLTPELIQYTAVQKLSPNIKVVGIPIGQGTIFDVGDLLTPEETPAP